MSKFRGGQQVRLNGTFTEGNIFAKVYIVENEKPDKFGYITILAQSNFYDDDPSASIPDHNNPIRLLVKEEDYELTESQPAGKYSILFAIQNIWTAPITNVPVGGIKSANWTYPAGALPTTRETIEATYCAPYWKVVRFITYRQP